MILPPSITLLGMALLISPAVGQDDSPKRLSEPEDDGAPAAGSAPATETTEHPDLSDDLKLLEAMLDVREARISEIRRLVELEKDVLDTVREQNQFGVQSPRQIELVEVRYTTASALLEAREAERDEIVVRIEALRRALASPSPETDRDEQQARLNDEVHIREAQLRAREARLAAAEAQVTSERHSQANFVDSVRRGIAAVGAARQAMFRLGEATAWRDTMAAERDVARVQLDRARRRLERFDDPASTDPNLDRPAVEDLEARVAALEHLVDVLRDEMYHMQWEQQIFRNMQHERFGSFDKPLPGRDQGLP